MQQLADQGLARVTRRMQRLNRVAEAAAAVLRAHPWNTLGGGKALHDALVAAEECVCGEAADGTRLPINDCPSPHAEVGP